MEGLLGILWKLGSCASCAVASVASWGRMEGTGRLRKEGKLGRKPGKLCHIMEEITAYYI